MSPFALKIVSVGIEAAFWLMCLMLVLWGLDFAWNVWKFSRRKE